MGRTPNTATGLLRAVCCLCGGLLPIQAPAYDGPVLNPLPYWGLRLGTGDGLVVRATRIEMTTSELSSVYEIENYGPDPVLRRVYAPVTPISLDMEENAAAFAGALNENPLGLTATVNGEPVDLSVKAAGSFLGLDITDELEAGGLGLSPFAADVEPDLAAASEAFRAMSSENGWVTSHGGAWQLVVLPSWLQRFAPETRTRIETRAKPVLGEMVDTIMKMEDIVLGVEGEPLSALCLLPEQEAEVRRLFASFGPDEFGTPYTIRTAEIVLTDMIPDTYAISNLQVSIMPDHPDDIVSVCGGDFAVQDDRSLVWKSAHAIPQTLGIFFIARDPAYRGR